MKVGLKSNLRSTVLLFLLLVGFLEWDRPTGPAVLLAAEPPEPPVAGGVDLAVLDLKLIQALPDEPLVAGKRTVAQVKLGVSGTEAVAAILSLDVNGQSYMRRVTVNPPVTTATLEVDPIRGLGRVTARAYVAPEGDRADPNGANNVRTTSPYATVHIATELSVFFLPVAWTPEQQSRYAYPAALKQYVQDAADFLLGVYPVPEDQLKWDWTATPFALTPAASALAGRTGRMDFSNTVALARSIAAAGHSYRPDAAFIVGVFPPNWLTQHGLSAEGFTIPAVGNVAASEFSVDDPATTAHELGHLLGLGDDTDCMVNRNRQCGRRPNYTGIAISVPGYWVERQREMVSSASEPIWTFMSGSDPETAFWTAPPIYEYLMARLAMQGGSASEPLILAATAAQHVDEEGAPSETSANTHRFEPGQPVYVSVAGIALSPGSTIEARLYRRSTLIKSESRAAAAGNRWYAFQVLDKKIVPADDYHVDVYLDGILAKTVEFEIKSGK